jgi:hypothetical protein
MNVYEFEGKADIFEKYVLNTQKKTGKNSAPTLRRQQRRISDEMS